MQSMDTRGQWGSKLGFILAASGSAVGLGNIWRFPYITGENGGAAFVLLYLLCVAFIGLPLLINELALGRRSGKNPVGAFLATKSGTPFVITGFLCLILCFVVLSYYGVIAGWAIGYAANAVVGKTPVFSEFVANPAVVLPCFIVFVLLTVLIVQGGVEKGIERWTKALMPLLLVMILVIIVRSLTLPGAMEGVKYYLAPDWSKIAGGETFGESLNQFFGVLVVALGQAFFSLSVGWGLMITYGSYMPKSQDIPAGGSWVALSDTIIALLGGLMVFPAVFAFGMTPDAGPGLTFIILPEVFNQMPFGAFFAALFFFLLTVAAVTSSISMLEVPVSYFVDEKIASRKVAAWMVGGAAILLGVPSALSAGGSTFFTEMTLFGKTGFLDIVDYVWGTVMVVVIALLCSIYTGWVWKTSEAVEELSEGSAKFSGGLAKAWVVFIKFVCPIFILIVLAVNLGILNLGN